jgi:hypothetical protein
VIDRHVRAVAIGSVLLCALLAAAPAAAQGNGRGNAYGHNKRPSGNPPASGATSSSSGGGGGADVSASSGSAIAPEGTGVRAFGAWLDDASVMAPGAGYVGFAVGYWRMPGFTEFDVPALDAGVGLTPRVQVSASVPFYHASATGQPVSRGVGDLQLSSKIQLRDPASGKGAPIGFALIPVVEISNVTAVEGASRVNWGLPVSVELRREKWRTYGSAGYFSRGAIFASGAVERQMSDRLWLTGTLSQSRSIKRDDLSEALGVPGVRTDVSGGATLVMSNTLAMFGSLGRTLSTQDPNRADLFVVGGLSINFIAWSD